MKQLLMQLQLRRLRRRIDEMTKRQKLPSSSLESALPVAMRFDGGRT